MERKGMGSGNRSCPRVRNFLRYKNSWKWGHLQNKSHISALFVAHLYREAQSNTHTWLLNGESAFWSRYILKWHLCAVFVHRESAQKLMQLLQKRKNFTVQGCKPHFEQDSLVWFILCERCLAERCVRFRNLCKRDINIQRKEWIWCSVAYYCSLLRSSWNIEESVNKEKWSYFLWKENSEREFCDKTKFWPAMN
jgi:hypothetical protein